VGAIHQAKSRVGLTAELGLFGIGINNSGEIDGELEGRYWGLLE
jgi:hypothetical protein